LPEDVAKRSGRDIARVFAAYGHPPWTARSLPLLVATVPTHGLEAFRPQSSPHIRELQRNIPRGSPKDAVHVPIVAAMTVADRMRAIGRERL
jgi:hypothetical protein